MTPSVPAAFRSWWQSAFGSAWGVSASEPLRPDYATPDAIGEAALQRRRAEERQLLGERVRIALLVLLAAAVAIAAGVDPAVHPESLWGLYAAKLVQLPVGIWLWRESRTAPRDRLVCGFVAMEVVVASVISFSSILVGEEWSAPVFCMGIVLGSAGLLPWGTKAQLVSSPLVLIVGLIPAFFLGDHEKIGLMTTLSSVIGVLAVLVAQEQERYRRTAWQSLLFFRENMERLRQIAEHINGVLWLGELGAGGEAFLYVSPRYDEIWGLDRRSLRDRPDAWLAAVHLDDRAAVEAGARRRDRAAPEGATIEYRIVRPDGAVRWIRDYAFPIRDVDGIPRRVARLSQDVTAEKEAATASRMRDLARSVHATREEERRRIARELHDELGQALTGIKLRLAGSLMAQADGDDGPARDGECDDEPAATMRACIGDADAALASLRSLIHQLHPPILDEVGLVAALRLQAETFAKRTGIACDLEVPDAEPELSGEELGAVFRVAQESLTNVARHARATRVEVRLSAQPRMLRLLVADDGCGMGGATRGFGLRGMSERAAVLNGTLRIQPGPQRGTVVQLEIPLHAEGDRA